MVLRDVRGREETAFDSTRRFETPLGPCYPGCNWQDTLGSGTDLGLSDLPWPSSKLMSSTSSMQPPCFPHDPTEVTLSLPNRGLTVTGLRWDRPGSLTPILALHGWLDNAASFRPLAPLLDDRTLVALDLPGHGRSDHKTPPAFYHFVDWPYDVLAAADALGWERFVVLGHSMGAGIAAVLAAMVPHRVEALMMIEGFGPLTASPEEQIQRMRDHAIKSRGDKPRDTRLHPTVESAVRARMLATDMDESSARILCERSLVEAEGGFGWRSDPRLRYPSPMPFAAPHVQAIMQAIECPTLLIKGNPGLKFESADLEDRIQLVRNLTVESVAGGHHVHMNKPEPISRIMKDFFASN